MPERIDAYSHVTTADLTDRLGEMAPALDYHTPPLSTRSNVEDRLARLDDLGIDRQVITQAEQRAWLGQDSDAVADVVRFANDEVRRYADAAPDRFVPVGTIPYPTADYVDEVHRCVDDLDMAGIQIFSNVDGAFLDDERFYPFYEAVEDAGVPVWIHPQDYPWHDYAAEDRWLYTMLGWPFDTTVALARLVFNGVLDEFEDLEIVSHHLGGFLPYVAERMYSWVDTRKEYPDDYTGGEAIAALSAPIESYFERIYADTAVSSRGWTTALETGIDFFGVENVLFAGDAAYGPGEGFAWTENVIPAIEDLDLTADERAKLFGGNATRLLD